MGFESVFGFGTGPYFFPHIHTELHRFAELAEFHINSMRADDWRYWSVTTLLANHRDSEALITRTPPRFGGMRAAAVFEQGTPLGIRTLSGQDYQHCFSTTRYSPHRRVYMKVLAAIVELG